MKQSPYHTIRKPAGRQTILPVGKGGFAMTKIARVLLPLVVLSVVAAVTIAAQCCIGSLCIPLG